MSLIYIVQRIRPDLVRKQEPAIEEVFPSPSIHSASVVDTLSGLFVTEPNLSISHLDPVEVGSYQRFDSVRREDSRAMIVDPVQGRLASKTEIEAVYKQAIDSMSVHHRSGSDTVSITRSNVPTQSHSGSVFSGSMLSSTEITGNVDSPSRLQITLGEKGELPSSAASCATLIVADNVPLSDELEGGVQIPGTDETMLQGDDQGTHQTGVQQDEGSLTSEIFSIEATSSIGTQTALGDNGAEEDETISVAQPVSDISVSFTKDQRLQLEPQDNREMNLPETVMADNIRDKELDVELVKLPPPPESSRKRRTVPSAQDEEDDTGEDNENAFKPNSQGVSEGIIDTQQVVSDGETVRDNNGSTMPLLNEAYSSDRVDAVQDEPLNVNEVLELVRLPPPPKVPRTGQLVTIESETVNDHRDANLTERESISVGHASLSEVKLDAFQTDISDKIGVDDSSSSKEVSTTHRKERLHLAVIDQLNLLSERLEAVAARQVEEEELEGENGELPDQRPVFSPALQSLPLTPLYSATHSVPLTPVRAWSSYVNTAAPTPLQTPQSTFHTTAPTPIPTPRSASQSVSDVFNVASETQTPHDSNDLFDACSPSHSQGGASRHRSRCSSFSEVGQEYVLNEWSHLEQRDTQGSMEAFPSKPTSGTNSSISSSVRSLSDFNSVSEPINIVGSTENERQDGHWNSPENATADQTLEPSLPMCLPRQPFLQAPNTVNPFQETYLNTNQRELQPSQRHDWTYKVEEVAGEEEKFRNEGRECLPQQTIHQQFNTTDDSEENLHQSRLTDLTPDQVHKRFEPESENIAQTSFQDGSSQKDIFNFNASEPQQVAYLKNEFTTHSVADLNEQSHMDPSTVDSKLHPFLDSYQNETIQISQQNPFQQVGVCASVEILDEPQDLITSNLVAVSMQQTRLDSSSVESKVTPFVEPDQSESVEVSQEISEENSFQQRGVSLSDGDPDELQITSQIPEASVSQREQPLLSTYQTTSVSPEQDHVKSKKIVITSSEVQSSTKSDLSHQTKELPYQCDHTENLDDQRTMPQQNTSMEMELVANLGSENSKVSPTDRAYISLDSTKEENDRTLDNQSTWTTFSRSEEVLIFEMDTESESTSGSSEKVESESTSSSKETRHVKQDPHAAIGDDNTLFPPLHIFSDIVDSTVEANRSGVPQKLPPPPKQAQRKRTDLSFYVNTEHARSLKVDGNYSQLKQERTALEGTKNLEEHQVTAIQNEYVIQESGTVQSHSVTSDEDLSATLNSVSEIESDMLTDFKPAGPMQDQCASRLSDNSITDIICQEFEFTEGKDDVLINEEGDDSILDEELAKTDIAPLLMQSEEPVQVLNLRDLPEGCHVLQKRPSTTSSTDDSSTSGTSTDSSLSETEIVPYVKLHEDSYTSDG